MSLDKFKRKSLRDKIEGAPKPEEVTEEEATEVKGEEVSVEGAEVSVEKKPKIKKERKGKKL